MGPEKKLVAALQDKVEGRTIWKPHHFSQLNFTYIEVNRYFQILDMNC